MRFNAKAQPQEIVWPQIAQMTQKEDAYLCNLWLKLDSVSGGADHARAGLWRAPPIIVSSDHSVSLVAARAALRLCVHSNFLGLL